MGKLIIAALAIIAGTASAYADDCARLPIPNTNAFTLVDVNCLGAQVDTIADEPEHEGK